MAAAADTPKVSVRSVRAGGRVIIAKNVYVNNATESEEEAVFGFDPSDSFDGASDDSSSSSHEKRKKKKKVAVKKALAPKKKIVRKRASPHVTHTPKGNAYYLIGSTQ